MAETKAQHTPEAWYRAATSHAYRDGGPHYQSAVRVRSDAPGAAVVVAKAVGRTQAEVEQRADLIAAAPDLLTAIRDAEAALGENLGWLTDRLDLSIRQKDTDTLRRLAQLNEAWTGLCRAVARAEGRQ